MLPTKEELARNFTTFSNQKLLDIVTKMEARPEAIEAAKEELRSRNVSTDTVTEYVQTKQVEKIVASENATIPLPLHQKFLFFFAWFIPFFLGSAFKLNYEEDGMVKKVKQTKWFSIAGFLALIPTTILSVTYELGNFSSLSILLAIFFIFLLVEAQINK